MFSKSRTFIVGDIHGAYKALLHCLEKVQFNYSRDRLICLGDVCDGWPEVDKCLDRLLQIKKKVLILGNHDEMALKWAQSSFKSKAWRADGGEGTMNSYPMGMNQQHIELLSKARSYYIYRGRLFVHGGFNPKIPIKKQSLESLLWDRTLVEKAMNQKRENKEQQITKYKEVYVGHTPTLRYGKKKPIHACEVFLMDTGAGWNGRLSMMDMDTKELFQSKEVPLYYPDYKGRLT